MRIELTYKGFADRLLALLTTADSTEQPQNQQFLSAFCPPSLLLMPSTLIDPLCQGWDE